MNKRGILKNVLFFLREIKRGLRNKEIKQGSRALIIGMVFAGVSACSKDTQPSKTIVQQQKANQNALVNQKIESCQEYFSGELHVKATHKAKTPLLLCFLAEHSSAIEPLITRCKHDFMFSGQIMVTIRKVIEKPTKKDIQQLFTQGYPLALFITQGPEDSLEWRLFDTLLGTMVHGKRCIKRGDRVEGWAHQVADSIWPLLTGQDPFFSTKIAYCKQVCLDSGKRVKHVCIADYDGSNEQIMVDTPTIHVAPRWNGDKAKPLLFYSEYTNENIRLMSVDMHKIRRIASSFDGINMLPAFSRDGKKVAYCASRGDGTCQLYYGEKGIFKKITHNTGNNVSPTLFDDGSSVIFCSDFQTGQPQIYRYMVESELLERLTQGGYCASPSYCGKRHQIAYGKIDQGTMQLYIYDFNKRQHTRLTHDMGNKEEYSWSPCGNYILFSVEKGRNSRIAVFNIVTQERFYITPSNQHCSYPTWSPSYGTYIYV